jgi:hypothetical protein
MKLKIGHTYYQDSDELSGVVDVGFMGDKIKYLTVKLFLWGDYLLAEYNDIDSVVGNFCNDDLAYRFVEVQDDGSSGSLFRMQLSRCCDRMLVFRNHNGIGSNWKLYLNSKSDVVVQHKLFPENNITVRFNNFPTDNTFYIHLSCLIYTLTNYEIQTSTDMHVTFDNVRKSVIDVDGNLHR